MRNIKSGSNTQSSTIIGFNKDTLAVLNCLNTFAIDANSSASLIVTHQANDYWAVNNNKIQPGPNIKFSPHSYISTNGKVLIREPSKNFEFPLGCNAI